MRFNKTILVILLGAFVSQAWGFQAVVAQPESKPESKPENKNDGRKLSMTIPGIGTANITVTPAQVKPISFGKPLAPGRHITLGPLGVDRKDTSDKKDLSIETNGSNITVRVPASIDAAIDDAQVVSRQVGRYASSGLAGVYRVVDLIVLYTKQWSTTTTITPGGYPYVEKSSNINGFGQIAAPTNIASGHRLYFTGEGRLKSVVTR
jgi:hypothetical protein